MKLDEPARIAVGVIQKPRGIHREVSVEPWTGLR